MHWSVFSCKYNKQLLSPSLSPHKAKAFDAIACGQRSFFVSFTCTHRGSTASLGKPINDTDQCLNNILCPSKSLKLFLPSHLSCSLTPQNTIIQIIQYSHRQSHENNNACPSFHLAPSRRSRLLRSGGRCRHLQEKVAQLVQSDNELLPRPQQVRLYLSGCVG